ncbi:MAG: penicillin-binding transpeptidase domain-containing protein [Patescibacteria group bacterium]
MISRYSRGNEIEPDEIFLDSSNLPDFDTNQFEGRIEKPISRRTLKITGFFFILIALVFLFKLTALQIADGEKYREISENNRLHHSLIFSERGAILDRNDMLLAWNTVDPDRTDFSFRAYKTEQGLHSLLGFIKYPKKDKYGFYYNTEYIGGGGVEEYFNDLMTGENGLKITETDALGKSISESMVRPAKKGENLNLSIDARLQEQLYTSIKNIAQQSGFNGGAGIMMDIASGEVLASVSYPEYNSAVMTDGKDSEAIKRFLTDERNPFLDRVTDGLYTPGSIVKPMFAFAALEEEIITPEKQIESTGSLKIPNPYRPGEFTVFNDWKAHGYTDMREAIAVSSDVYFYQIGGGFMSQKGLGIENIDRYAQMFGLGRAIENSYFGGKKGVIPTPEWKAANFNGDIWRVGDTYNTSIGQYGFQITPAQAVRMTAAIANNGTLLTPTILKNNGGDSVIKEQIAVKDTKHLQVAREGMRLAVTNGTLGALNTPYVEIAAKSGTAQLGTLKRYINSWVVGFYPYDKPKYAFAVLLEKGPATTLIGATAAMRTFMDWVAIYIPEYLN